MSFDMDFVKDLVVLATINMVVAIAIGTGVVRVVLRQRAIENAWRLRIARWHSQAGPSSEEPIPGLRRS